MAAWMMPAAIGGSAILGLLGNRSAGREQARAAEQAAATQMAMFQQSRADMEPWRRAGVSALNTLVPATATEFGTDPGYQFRFNEGMRAVMNNRAAQGNLNSGAATRALMQTGQGLADQQYGDWWNRNATLAGLGQTSTNAGAMLAGQAGQGIGASQYAAGTARANGLTGGLNALLQGGGSLLGYYQQQNDPMRAALLARFGGGGTMGGYGAP